MNDIVGVNQKENVHGCWTGPGSDCLTMCVCVCLAVRPSAHQGRTGLDQIVCVLVSNCLTQAGPGRPVCCVFCLSVCPSIGVGPDRISMEAPMLEPEHSKRWKRLRLSQSGSEAEKPAPTKMSKSWRIGVLKPKRWIIAVKSTPKRLNGKVSPASAQFSQCQLVVVVSPASAQFTHFVVANDSVAAA